MDYISNNKTIDTFDGTRPLQSCLRGEEYRLFSEILNLVQESIKNNVYPLCYGDCHFGQRLFGLERYLAREHSEYPGFPDLLYFNEQYVLCIDHTQINASNPRCNYKNGDEYRAFLGRHRDLLEDNRYNELADLCEKEGIVFSIPNLVNSMLHALNMKVPKIPTYKKAAKEYIASGNFPEIISEDLAKNMEVWLLIEDVSPTNSFDSIFCNEDVLSLLKESGNLDGLIFIHHYFLTQPPRNIEEIVFIHNDPIAHKALNLLKNNDFFKHLSAGNEINDG